MKSENLHQILANYHEKNTLKYYSNCANFYEDALSRNIKHGYRVKFDNLLLGLCFFLLMAIVNQAKL